MADEFDAEGGVEVDVNADEGNEEFGEEGMDAEPAEETPPGKKLMPRAKQTAIKAEFKKELCDPFEAPRKRGVVNMGARTEHELFVEKKRTESTLRDTACKAVCKIKHGLRQPGAQEDGRPIIPEDWDTQFKPKLGSYIKFLLSRPDQFRVKEGSGIGFYTIEDVTMNKTVVAPTVDKGSGKGKDKGKGKGKGKFKSFGKDDKGAKGKKGKAWGKRGWDFGKGGKGYNSGKEWHMQGANGDQTEDSKADVGGPPTKAALLLAAAAREALGLDAQQTGEEPAESMPDEEGDGVDPDTLNNEAEDDADIEGGLGGEDEVEDEEDMALPPLSPDAAEEDDEDAERPTAKHGSYINLLFSGGVFGNSSKKQRTS